jgi:hypothetical protein
MESLAEICKAFFVSEIFILILLYSFIHNHFICFIISSKKPRNVNLCFFIACKIKEH